MTKTLRFSVKEISNRTWELPYEEALKIIKENCDAYEPSEWGELEIAEHLYNCLSDDIAKYEVDNGYFDSEVDEAEIYE